MLKRPWLLLLAALALLPWTGLQTAIPFAIWVAPALVLRYTRTERSTVRAWLLVILVYLLADLVRLRGPLIPLPYGVLLALALLSGLIRSIPYALDRWLHPRLRNLASSLVFPVAMTGMEWLFLRYGPYGSWGSSAYSQYYDLPLIQIVSITGISGLTFLVHWLAPVMNDLVEEAPAIGASRVSALAFLSVLGLVLGYGGFRLAFSRNDNVSVTAAAVVPGTQDYATTFGGVDLKELSRGPDSTRRIAGTRFTAGSDRLFDQTVKAARLGARIVVWPEWVPVLEEDRQTLIEKARSVARAEHIFLMITPLSSRKSDRHPYLENIATLIDPSGEIRWRYAKTYPVVGLETGLYGQGPGRIPVVSSPFGRLAPAICQDLDFPWLIRLAGVQKADILITPSDDWQEIEETHAQMAVYRAIENGFSIIRSANNGISQAVDPYGRIRALSPASELGTPPMIAELPTHRVQTLYTRLGDWFAWLNLAGLIGYVALMGVPLERRRMDG